MNERRKTAKKKHFVNALREHGIIGIAAKAAGIHRGTAWRWTNEDPEFAERVGNAREDAVDVIEESLYTKAKNGDTISQIFYLKARRHIFRDRLAIDVEAVDLEIQARMERLGIVNGVLPPGFAVDGPSELKLLESGKGGADDDSSNDNENE